jgi:hypothetical protein
MIGAGRGCFQRLLENRFDLFPKPATDSAWPHIRLPPVGAAERHDAHHVSTAAKHEIPNEE